jgi:UDP-glucose 4-epimerase
VCAFAPDVVLDLGWGGVSGPDRQDLSQIDNVAATIELVQLAHRARARAFIGLGSQAEYGRCAARIDELAPVRPTTLYGTAKLCAGLLAERMCETLGLRFAWLRLFSAYGPKDHPATLVSQLCAALLAGRRFATTAGEQQWDYVYVEDAAEAIARVALEPRASGVYNLGSGRVQTIRSVVEQLRDLIRPGAEIGFGEVPYAPDQIMHLEADVDRLRRATGWEPETTLEAGLERTVTWHRGQR